MNGSDQPRDDREIVRGRDGKPLLDRYGRPIYRRSGPARGAGSRGGSSLDDGRVAPHHFTRGDIEELRRLREQRERDQREREQAGRSRREPDPRQRRERRATPPANETQMFGRPDEFRGNAGDTSHRRDAARYRGQDDPRFPPRGYDPDRDFAGGRTRDTFSADPGDGAAHRSDARDWADGGGGERRKALPFLDRFRRSDRRGPRRPRNIRRTVQVTLLVVLLMLAGGAAWVDINLQRVDAFAGGYDRPGRSMSTNWLLVGSDSRAGLTEEDAAALSTGAGDFGQRTDTIMIAHFPLVGKGKLVSIPRDSYVEIPGYGNNKVNAAYSFGGAQLLAQTVEHNTGIRIDHYAEIGFGGFANIVDAMGGIEMCPAEAIQDPLAGLDIQAGCQKFDGAAGLGYVRTRATAQGDLDRVARQREFMGAMMGRMTSPAVWLNPWRLYKLGSSGAKAITVDSGDHVWHLAWLMARMALGTDSETVPTAGTMDTAEAGNVLLWDTAATPAFFGDLK